MRRRALSTIARLSPLVVALLGLLGIAVLAVWYAGPQSEGTGLSGEYNVPALFSGGLLALAALTAWAYAADGAPTRRESRVAGLFAGLVGFFAVDETVKIHERIGRGLDVEWQPVYAPILTVGAVVGVLLLWAFRHRPAPLLLMTGGGSAWVLSQALEAVQWHGYVLVHPQLQYPEELLEMLGSLSFAVAMLVASRVPAVALPPDRAGVSSAAGPS